MIYHIITKRFWFNKNHKWLSFFSSGKESQFCTKFKSWNFFNVSSLLLLSSAAFYNLTPDIVQNVRRWSNLLHTIFFLLCGINAGNPKQQRWAQVANQNTRFASSCPWALLAIRWWKLMQCLRTVNMVLHFSQPHWKSDNNLPLK